MVYIPKKMSAFSLEEYVKDYINSLQCGFTLSININKYKNLVVAIIKLLYTIKNSFIKIKMLK